MTKEITIAIIRDSLVNGNKKAAEDAIKECKKMEAIEFSKYLHKKFMAWDEGGQYNWKAHNDEIGVISFTHAYEYFLQSKL